MGILSRPNTQNSSPLVFGVAGLSSLYRTGLREKLRAHCSPERVAGVASKKLDARHLAQSHTAAATLNGYLSSRSTRAKWCGHTSNTISLLCGCEWACSSKLVAQGLR